MTLKDKSNLIAKAAKEYNKKTNGSRGPREMYGFHATMIANRYNLDPQFFRKLVIDYG